MEELYTIVEFDDGLQMIPTSWLIEDKNAAYWPQFTSHARFAKAVKKNISPVDNWPIYNVKRILATASKLHKQNKCYVTIKYQTDKISWEETNYLRKNVLNQSYKA